MVTLEDRCLTLEDGAKFMRLRDEHMEEVFQHNRKNGTLTICLKYPYEIDLDRIKTPAHLIDFISHLCGKSWMDTDHLREFVDRVSKIKRFKIPDA